MSSLISNRLHSFQNFQKSYYTQELLHARQLEQSLAQQKTAEQKAPTPQNTPRHPTKENHNNNRGSFQSPQPQQQYNNDIHLPPARRQSQPKVKKPSKVKTPKVRFNKTPEYQSQSLNPVHYQNNNKNNTNMTDDDYNQVEEEVHEYEDEDLNFESEDKEQDEEDEELEEIDQDLYDDNDEKEEMIKSLLQGAFNEDSAKPKKSKKRKTGNSNTSMQL
jgi:hypothetical protein